MTTATADEPTDSPVDVAVPDDLIGPGEAARILACSGRTIATYREQGVLRAWRRAGSAWLYSEAEVRALLEPYVPQPPPRLVSRAELERREQTDLDALRALGVRL